MSADTIAARLRQVKDQNGWTAAEMATMIGISRRTLESYMRRENAPLPGVEALKQIALGLRVSLDWLVLGDVDAALGGVLLVRLAAERAALSTLKNLIEMQQHDELIPQPEYLAQEIGAHAAGLAETIVSSGLTMAQIAAFIQRSDEDMQKSMRKKIDEMKVQIADLERAHPELKR
ncbi:helix-turn-helix transcriptional regulator [Paracoccus sp. DMF-8]|uniref:helix-turn-helix domain-containing protein n=1 Tax=Paracoccus sp. DMF-8 TaxID=3019445 RepID=UPI0023E77F05|nr:helix-turn-helix transcriptional regulator [Paracoccus sp. DMF-8]MDF3605453.1 helix-turn-helix transcriptional regulator [Paracoccus sp. DMF-8]